MGKWLAWFGMVAGIWFASGFLSGLVWVSIGVGTRVYSQGVAVSALVSGGLGLLVLGPLWHLSRRQPGISITLCAVTAAALMNGFRMLLGYQSHGILTYNTLFDAAVPLLIGGSSAALCWVGYWYLDLGVGERKGQVSTSHPGERLG
ncbi:MAG: hypothetical protein HRF45_07070 [Fimbriimonadia bacterium]|jgi:hypothetical protein